MQRIKSFLVVCISILVAGSVWGQNISTGRLGAVGKPGSEVVRNAGQDAARAVGVVAWPGAHTAWQTPPLSIRGWDAASAGAVRIPVGVGTAISPVFSVPRALESDYYTRHFGFFCQKELQFEKTTRIPLRFRLGSLEQCNALEYPTSPVRH